MATRRKGYYRGRKVTFPDVRVGDIVFAWGEYFKVTKKPDEVGWIKIESLQRSVYLENFGADLLEEDSGRIWKFKGSSRKEH